MAHQNHLNHVQGGFEEYRQISSMMVKGKNQLIKEIDEISKIENKIFDQQGLHRNEETQEIEGQYGKSKKSETKKAANIQP